MGRSHSSIESMDRYFTKTFRHFALSFLVIIALAFGVIIVVAPQLEEASPSPVDNVALPR